MIAAECCAFLTDAEPLKSEKWKPYLGWSRALTPGDRVVTFNYDRVLEMLDARLLEVKPPGRWGLDNGDSARVYKLHGSVDWRREADGQYCLTDDPTFAVSCAPKELAIATPGPSKLASVTEMSFNWQEAVKAIRSAEAIVFVGFRFPPSDAEARSQIVGAIAENKTPHLELHTVLGPPSSAQTSADTTRLEHLLRSVARKRGRRPKDGRSWADGTFSVTAHPLFAEDFFSLYERRMLFDG